MPRLATATILVALVALVAALAATPIPAACLLQDSAQPRTLVLALDGVSYRIVQRAHELGAFDGWPEPAPLVSTFPSLTNVSFTAIFRPFGVSPALGYEIQHFDREQNMLVGGSPMNYDEQTYAWRDLFDVTGRTFGSKFSGYTFPKKKAHKELAEARKTVLSLRRDLVLVHVGATDVLAHLRGDDELVKFMLEVDEFLAELKRDHLEQRGRPLRVVLLSDHGNTEAKVHAAPGIRRSLRKTGLRVVDRLRTPDDVIAATFGIVSYGALFLADRDRAEEAATAIAGLEAVDVAAWVSSERQVTVASGDGTALIRWSDDPGGRSYSYEPLTADPLRLAEARERLERQGGLDAEGFATHQAWFEVSALGDFPDALRRLVQSLTGPYVKNTATVMFSVRPGYAWGWRSAHASSWIQGGRLEGTHGGLDRESTLGFLFSDDPVFQPRSKAVLAERALAAFADFGDCLATVASAPAAEATHGN